MNRREREFQERWGDLATYNSEVARGIVHTPEYDAKMREKQKQYNEQWLAALEDGREPA